MLRSLLRRQSEYIGSHAAERRPLPDTECVACGRSEPGTDEEPVRLAECSICKVWHCTPCHTFHAETPAPPSPRRAWWRRLLRKAPSND